MVVESYRYESVKGKLTAAAGHICRRAFIVAFLCTLPVVIAGEEGEDMTVLDHLRETPRPVFRAGHTLPRLTRWGWSMGYDINVELTENWGYALEFPGYATKERVEAALDDPESTASRLLELTAADPERYPLMVLCDRAPGHASFREQLPPETWCRDEDGELIDDRHVWSPEAPDEVWEKAAQWAIEPLKMIRERAPISIVLDGGEYALGVFGHHRETWQQDPAVQQARGEKGWFEYVSQRKGHQQGIIAERMKDALPDRDLLIFYYSVNAHRGRYGHWWHWSWDYRDMRVAGDLPSSSIYYRHYNDGWTGRNDMLTMALNAVGRALEFDDPLSYNWLNAGWERGGLGEDAHADIELFMGYLKCYYTAGMIGGVAGYFSPLEGRDGDTPVGDAPPHWLQQKIVIAHAHALFSHLEDFLRNGRLMPGAEDHAWRDDVPAYEFPTDDENVRVLARSHNEKNAWLVTAWAADGEETEIAVDIPPVPAQAGEYHEYPGRLTLLARPAGSVYHVSLDQNGDVHKLLLDRDPMYPTTDLPEF